MAQVSWTKIKASESGLSKVMSSGQFFEYAANDGIRDKNIAVAKRNLEADIHINNI